MYRRFFIITITLILIFPTLSFSKEKILPSPRTITVDARKNASDDSRKGWKKGKEVELPAGIWQIKAVGGGWSCWASDSKLTPDVKGAWTWNVYIKTPSNELSSPYGIVDDWWRFNSPQEALRNVQEHKIPFSITLNKLSKIYFWIYDNGGTSDNRGNVIIEISPQD